MCKLIGIGGFGRVTFKENQKEIARKELLLDHVTNELAQLRFKREIESLRKIKSEFHEKSFVLILLVERVNSIPCDFIVATLAYL